MRGAVLVELEPGWKTYWLDPGPSGLAPRLDFTRSSAIGDVTATLPAPMRQGSGPAEMIGYDAPVAFAFTGTAEPGAKPSVQLDLLVGICRDLCVPVAGTLEAGGGGVLSPEDAAAIDRAFLALPRRSDEPAQAQWTASEIRITALPMPDAEALFVEPVEGWRFGSARREGDAWLVPLLGRPPADGAHPPLRVLATGGERNPRGTRVDIP